MLPRCDRLRGMFLGVAIGDALGVPVETYDAARIARDYGRITTYLQNPSHKWSSRKPAGMWSDDTQLTLAVAEAIIETGSLDLDAQAKWHLKVLDELGDLGLGGSTRDALNRIRAGVSPHESGKTENPKRGMGNALPMKVSPVAVLAAQGRAFMAGLTSLTAMTHNTSVAAQSAYAHVMALGYCLERQPKKFFGGEFLLDAVDWYSVYARNELPSRGFPDLSVRWQELHPLLISGDLQRLSPAQLGTRYNSGDAFVVYNTLPLAYACFLRHPTSVEALYDAVAAGGDTDTNASIVGGLVGALNGTAVFPAHLVNGLAMRDRILDTAERLCERLGIKE